MKTEGIRRKSDITINKEEHRGFTLLEIMIALAIIGITLTVILHTVNYNTEILYQNTITTEMYQLAKEKMYELESNRVNSKGALNKNFTFENTVSVSEDPGIVELKTTIRGHGKEVQLTEIVINKTNESK